jgi:Flp pilus assembly protein TadG
MQSTPVFSRVYQRGNYSTMFAVTLPIFLGFGALAVDVSYVRLAEAQAQDIADSAAHAALVVFRKTDSENQAQIAATLQVANNKVAGVKPTLVNGEVDFGVWTLATESYDTTVPAGETANAVEAIVAREGANSVGMFLARLYGWNTTDVRRSAVTATRGIDVVLSIDITQSWNWTNFIKARAAILNFFDIVNTTAEPEDRIGLNVWYARWGVIITPLTPLASAGTIRAQWEMLALNSSPGWSTMTPAQLKLNTGVPSGLIRTNTSGGAPSGKQPCYFLHMERSYYAGTKKQRQSPTPADLPPSGSWTKEKYNNDFEFNASAVPTPRFTYHYRGVRLDRGLQTQDAADPVVPPTTVSGGCYPHMPRGYSDEGGTQHDIGLRAVKQMFDTAPPRPGAYRAEVMLTDGEPNGSVKYNAVSGMERSKVPYPLASSTTGFVEPRWDYYTGVATCTATSGFCVSSSTVDDRTIAVANDLWNNYRVHQWFVSFLKHENWFGNMGDPTAPTIARGHGYYALANDADDLTPIFTDIAESLPLTLVR